MPEDIRQYKVFVASPGDVRDERDRLERAVEEVNSYAELDGYRLRLWRYEEDADPGLHPDGPQPVISEQIGEVDIFVGILWSRIGTPTADAVSGTVQEFEEAYRQWTESDRTRPRIMFYFKRDALVPSLEALPQLQKALEFKARVEKLGLTTEFDDADDFERLVRRSLVRRSRAMHFGKQASIASEQSPPQETGAGGEDEREAGEDLIGMRLGLERKMTWLCKHLLDTDGIPAFATIGSLAYDGYLSLEQARLASRILALDPGAVSGRPEEVAEFRAGAAQVVRTFRAIVFDNHVRMHLPPGWEAKTFSQAPGHREDFIALNGDVAYRVSARFALPEDSSLVKKSVERLARGEDDPTELDGKPIPVAGRIVVVPDATSVPQGEGAGGVRVVKQCELAEALQAPARTPA